LKLFEDSDDLGNQLCLWVTCCSTKTRAAMASPFLENSGTELDKTVAELIQRWK